MTAQNVLWFQGELGFERKTRAGFDFRISAGIAEIVSSPNWACTIDGAPAPCGHRLPTNPLPVMTL